MSNQIKSDKMVMTILEAHVSSEKWATLQNTYSQSVSRLPPQMVQTFLVQGTTDPTLWQGISIWRSREALAEYRQSVETPEGIVMFRAVDAEPTLTILEVVVNAQHSSQAENLSV